MTGAALIPDRVARVERDIRGLRSRLVREIERVRCVLMGQGPVHAATQTGAADDDSAALRHLCKAQAATIDGLCREVQGARAAYLHRPDAAPVAPEVRAPTPTLELMVENAQLRRELALQEATARDTIGLIELALDRTRQQLHRLMKAHRHCRTKQDDLQCTIDALQLKVESSNSSGNKVDATQQAICG